MGESTATLKYSFSKALSETTGRFEGLSAGKKADFHRTVAQSKEPVKADSKAASSRK